MTLSERIREKLKANIAEEERAIAYHKEIAEILATFKGKTLTARLKTLFEKKHPDFAVHYALDYGLIYLSFWGRSSGYDYEHRQRHFIGHHGMGTDVRQNYDPATFEENDVSHGSAAEERNNLRRGFLATDGPEKLAQAITDAKEAIAVCVSFTEHPFPDSSDVETIAGFKF